MRGSSELAILLPPDAPLHARPAGLLARRAMSFASTITIAFGRRQADAKNALAVMALGACGGDVVRVHAVGPDAQRAVDAVGELLLATDQPPALAGRPNQDHCENPMTERTVTVASKAGLHARPAMLFVQAVAKGSAPVRIGRPGQDPVDASSILSVMSLGVQNGDQVVLACDDVDLLEELVTMLGADLDAA